MSEETESEHTSRDLVYGKFGLDGVAILPRNVADHLSELSEALSTPTWGDLRRIARPEVYAEIVAYAGYGDLDDFMAHLDTGTPVPGARNTALRQFLEIQNDPLPDDDEPFDGYSIPACADGDFPPSPKLLMMDYLPRDVIDRYGDVYETNFNGTFVELPADKLAEILSDLRASGYTCTEDQTLIDSTNFLGE